MGDGEPGALTELAGATEADTELAYAWAEDWPEDEPTQRLTPRRITALGIAGSLLAIAIAAVVAFQVITDAKRDATIGHPVLDGEAKSGISGTYIEPPPPPAPVTVTQTVKAEPETPVETIEPTASAPQLTAYDHQFLQALQADGWKITDQRQILRNAYRVCLSLQQGQDLPQISQEMATVLADVDLSGAHQFASEVLTTYPSCHS